MRKNLMEDFGFYLVMTNPVVGYAKCAEAAVKAGVKIIQLRMKHASREDVLSEAREVRRVTAGTGTGSTPWAQRTRPWPSASGDT